MAEGRAGASTTRARKLEPGKPAPRKSAGARPRVLRTELCVEGGNWDGLCDIEPMVARLTAVLVRHVELPAARALACVVLGSDAIVMALNKTWRGQDKPTNVLSFPGTRLTMIGTRGETFLGDVILARETLVREAEEQGIPLDHHFNHLVLHGLLHLACSTTGPR